MDHFAGLDVSVKETTRPGPPAMSAFAPLSAE